MVSVLRRDEIREGTEKHIGVSKRQTQEKYGTFTHLTINQKFLYAITTVNWPSGFEVFHKPT